MKRFSTTETRKDDAGRFGESDTKWIDAKNIDDVVDLFTSRYGETLANYRGSTGRDATLVFYIENGNNPYTLYVDIYLSK